MVEKEGLENKRTSLKKFTKKKVLKITSVAIVTLMVLVSYHGIRLNLSAEDDDPPASEQKANAGYEDFYHYTGGMVNTANGNLYITHKDISIKGRGFNIEIIRAFNTLERENTYEQDWFGYGWTCNYFIYLQEDEESGNVTLTEGDGSVHVYTPLGGGSYSTPAGKHGRLNKNKDCTFIIRFLDGSKYDFDPNGILQYITDKNGNKLTFTYSSGKLIKVEDDSGQYLNLSYSGTKISNITDPQGRKITYSYRGEHLLNVTDATGNCTFYESITDVRENITLLLSTIDNVGHRLNFTYLPFACDYLPYYSTIRVKEIYSSMWNFSSESAYNTIKMYSFTYLDYPGSYAISDFYWGTNITDALGYTTRVYMNDYGNPLKIEDPTGNYTLTEWDSDFNRISYTDANNETYNYTYETYYEGNQTKTYGQPENVSDPTGNYTEYEWEFKNEDEVYISYLNSVTNKRGYSTKYTYDKSYNMNSTEDARGNKSYRTYDIHGNMISYKDFRGFSTTYSYDEYGNLLYVTDPGGNVTYYEYDNLNRLVNIINTRGYVTTYEYDDLDRIVKITDALGNSTTYIYDDGSEGIYTTGIYVGCGGGYSIGGHTPISIIDANGHQTNLTLNHTIKRIEKIEESVGCGCSEKNFNYDKNGNLIEFIDAKGNKTTYEYDSQNRLINETDARGNYTTYTYNANGYLISKTNKRGYTTTYEYDSLGRKIKETDATGNSTEYTYDEEGNLKTMKNAREYTTTYYYDELNRLIKVEDALNHNTTYTYDESGNKKTETDPNGNTVTFYYDSQNRLIRTKDALNHETTYDYDANNNKLNETDANGNKTKFAYDALNRMTSITDANNNVTYYSYDATGRLLNITDANNHKTRQEYDSLGRLKKVIYPSGNETEYSYDNVGNLIEREDAKGLSTLYDYDELNRLEKVTYPDGSTIDYEYNEEGNPTKVTTNASFGETTYYTYDELDRVISVRADYGAFDKYINYTYDEVGNRKTMIVPEGNTTSYTYDAVDRLINITASGHNPILFQYDNGGRRTRLDYPNGAYTIYSYDNANRITTIWHKKSGGTTIAKYTYTYDNAGNILNFTENDVNYTLYTYDNLYRLTNVSYPDGSWAAYTYDGIGNRLTLKTSSGTTSYTYDVDNRILTAGSVTYKHDENGNLINRTDSGNTTLYEYDYDNQLKKVTLPDSSTVIYQYSADKHRLNKTSTTGTTLYVYDGDNILMELDENGDKTAFYAYGPNIDEPILMVISGASYYYHADHLGNIRVLTDSNENVMATYQYDAFGSILLETGSVKNPYRYTGREWDVESGLYYYRARYYNAIFGRFMQKDPRDDAYKTGENMYVYVTNNPVNFKDPTGTGCDWWDIGCHLTAGKKMIGGWLYKGITWLTGGGIKTNLCCALYSPWLKIDVHTDWDYFYNCIGVGGTYGYIFIGCLIGICLSVCLSIGVWTVGTACLLCIGFCAGVELTKVIWCYARATTLHFYLSKTCLIWLPC